MAKLTIAQEIDAMVKGGATVVDKFVDEKGNPLTVRNMDSTNDPLEVGDVITIPTDYKVVLTDINGIKYPCTIAEVKAEDGSERNMRLFPNSFAKVVFPLDENGKRMGKVKTSGEVAKWYADQETIDKAMTGLAGKRVKVTNKESFTVKKYQSEETTTTNVYSYDWALE